MSWQNVKVRWLTTGLGLALAAAAPFALRPTVTAAQQASCGFELGFQTLHDLMPGIVGDCVENEWHNADNGDGLQRTTNGLLVWRKADNWTAFTDGNVTWINGPFGLQSRLNTERFPWESLADAAPAVEPVASTTAPPPTPTPTSTTSSSSSEERPRIDLDISSDRVDPGETFRIRLEARDDNGVDRMWWWATDTHDDALRDTHGHDCDGDDPCRHTWDESTDRDGTIRIHAKARDRDGNESDEVTQDVRVR